MNGIDLFNFLKNNGIELNKDDPNNIIAFIPYYLLEEFKNMLGYTFLSDSILKVVLKKDYVCFEMPMIFEYFNIFPEDFLDYGEPKKFEETYNIEKTLRQYTASELFYTLGRMNPVLYCGSELYHQLKFMDMVEFDTVVKIGEDDCDIIISDMLLPHKGGNGNIIGILISENRTCLIYEKENL